MKLIHIIIVAFCIAVIFFVSSLYILVTQVKAVENEFDIGCSAGMSDPIVLPALTIWVLPWVIEYYDTDNIHEGSETRYTIPIEGKYLVSGQIFFYSNYGLDELVVIVKLNGSSYRGRQNEDGNGAKGITVNVADVMDLEAGDYLELVAHSNLDCVIEVTYTKFSIQRVGIGSDAMEITVVFQPGLYILGLGIVLILANIFLKNPFIYLAIFACMFGVYLSPEFRENNWLLFVAILISLYSGFGAYYRFSTGQHGRY